MEKQTPKLKSAETTTFYRLRVALVVILFLAGITFVIYAAAFHTIPVLVETEVEVIPEIPEIDPIEAMRMSPEELDEFLNPAPVREYEMVTEDRSEPVIVQGVTVGAYGRAAGGEIEYLFAEGEELPDICPT